LVASRAGYARRVGEPTSTTGRLEVIGLGGRYHWPSERSDVPKGVCPHCEQVITRVLSCSCSREAFFGRAAIGSIMRGPE
jgi:hypothetical protein